MHREHTEDLSMKKKNILFSFHSFQLGCIFIGKVGVGIAEVLVGALAGDTACRAASAG